MPTTLALALLLFACAFAARAGADAVDDLVRAQMRRQNIPGLALAVVREGRLVKAQGYGYANLELKVKATPHTVFQIQSVTKQFTATAIMMLVEEGKLGLDDPVSKHLEGTPQSWKGITIRHLLSHTSGIKDFINEPTANLRIDVTEEEVLQATAPRPLNFQPGERYAYSNTNYHLLAMILHKLTGKPWYDVVKERICDPLGMGDTRVIRLRELIPDRAAGYTPAGSRPEDGVLNGDYVAESILGYAGGGLRSTVLDMAKWDAALYTEKLLKHSSLEQMWTSAKLNNGSPAGYGFGWGVGATSGHRFVSHTGGHYTGFATIITRYLDDKLTVIVLTNRAGADTNAIAQGVAGKFVPALAPPVYRPIKDTEPKVTEKVRALVAETLAGTLRQEDFTAQMWAEVYPDRLKSAQEFLKGYGALRSVSLLDRKEEAGSRMYRYRLRFEKGRLALVLVLNKEGRASEMGITPD